MDGFGFTFIVCHGATVVQQCNTEASQNRADS